MKFNSQICTTKEQSQKLLELGLKPETADMCYYLSNPQDTENPYTRMVLEDYIFIHLGEEGFEKFTPAWSLHRLLYSLMPNSVKDYCLSVYSGYVITYDSLYGSSYDVCKEFNKSLNIYDNIVDCIEWLISNGYFNKEYLCDK